MPGMFFTERGEAAFLENPDEAIDAVRAWEEADRCLTAALAAAEVYERLSEELDRAESMSEPMYPEESYRLGELIDKETEAMSLYNRLADRRSGIIGTLVDCYRMEKIREVAVASANERIALHKANPDLEKRIEIADKVFEEAKNEVPTLKERQAAAQETLSAANAAREESLKAAEGKLCLLPARAQEAVKASLAESRNLAFSEAHRTEYVEHIVREPRQMQEQAMERVRELGMSHAAHSR